MKKSIDLREVDSFGEVAAEEDPVLNYFLATQTHDSIASCNSLLVLGRKGAGKTALVRHFAENESTDILSQALSFRSYPWAAHASRIDQGASESEAYFASWQFFLSAELCKLVFKLAPDKSHAPVRRIASFLKANYGTTMPDSADLLRPPAIKCEGTFEPQLMGSKIGSLSWNRSKGDFGLGSEISALSKSMLLAVADVVEAQLPDDVILLHLDELDQGLTDLDAQRSHMMIGLILAARAIRQHFSSKSLRISPVVYLRTDLWDELVFSDKNKITQTLALPIEWDEDQLRQLIERRASVILDVDANWSDLEDGDLMRGSQPKWRHMAARTYLRPRDMIRFCNAALDGLKRRDSDLSVFTNKDITDARDVYSTYLKSELDDEIMPHWSTWHDALDALSRIQTLTFDVEMFAEEYEKSKGDDSLDWNLALQRLWDFSVVGYERRSGYGGSSWAFRYQSPELRWDQGAKRFKTHLGLKEFCRLKEERATS